MIRGDEIKQLVSNLKRRVLLAHACQFQDFESYLHLGGVPSRQLLETSVLPFTRFVSDDRDKQNGVWDKVFANLSDFWSTFAWGGSGTPNAFGPILLLLQADALLPATEVAVTLRSAGEPDFDRNRESLGSADEVERIFENPLRGQPPPHGMVNPNDLLDGSPLKWQRALEREFPGRRIKTPEIHCSIPGGLLPFQFLKQIVVDPYRPAGQPLRDAVEELALRGGIQSSVEERRANRVRFALYQELWNLCAGNEPSLTDVASSPRSSDVLKEWAQQLLTRDVSEQRRIFHNYAAYLRSGTISPMGDRGK
jgi:hypothetical protein